MKTIDSALLTYSQNEERLNILTHAIGMLVAIYGSVLLVQRANSIAEVTSVSIYGASLILMFLASTVYHSVFQQRIKQKFKIIDHAAIYLLIAGTYTPFLIISLEGAIAVASTIIIWLLAVVGVCFKVFTGTRFPKASLITYLGMGWFVLLIIYPLYQTLHTNGLWLLFAGGICFSVGVIFYTAKSIRFTHAIWHLFVIAGCTCHFLSVYNYVIT